MDLAAGMGEESSSVSTGVVFPDADDAGERMAAAVQASIPWAVIVRLPAGRDVRQVIQQDGVETLLRFVDEALLTRRLYATMAASSTLPDFEAAWSEVSRDAA